MSSNIADRGGSGSMPPVYDDVLKLDAAKRLIAGAWHVDGALEFANPAVDAEATVSAITKTSATLTGFANDNGRSSSYYYQYGPQDYNTRTIDGTQSNLGTGGDGSVTSKTVTNTISGLNCGTSYLYRMRGHDQDATSTRLTTGLGSSFTTSACNAAPTISGTPATSIVQDVVYSFIPAAFDDENDALTFSIVNKPTWASFSTTTGALTGSPTNVDVGTTTTGIVITVTDTSNASNSLGGFNLTVININGCSSFKSTDFINYPSTNLKFV
ncbi:MAG: hypothetical protein HRT37_24165 [Alteromonadaceae bacterium]|nr:hypothetical protein [Alteromonadaceae bacterium]